MNKLTLKGREEILDATEDAKHIGTGTWRWGYTETYVLERSPGEFYKFTVLFHSQEGIQDDEIDLVRVYPHQVMTTVWKTVPQEETPNE